MTSTTGIVRQAGEGERFWFAGGGVFTMKASSEETGGALMLFEDDVVRGKTTPLHLHPSHEEVIYVLEGAILAHVDGDEHEVDAGGVVVAPRGVPHAFLVTSDKARLLALVTPGSGEQFFRDASESLRSESDAGRPGDFKRLQEVAESSDAIQLLGPPPFAHALDGADPG